MQAATWTEIAEPVELADIRQSAASTLPDEILVPDVIIVPDDAAEFGHAVFDPWNWLPAVALSLLFHVWLMSSLATIEIREETSYYVPAIESRIVSTLPLETPEEVVEFELADPNDRDHELHQTLNAPSVGLSLATEPKFESAPTRVLQDEFAVVPTGPIYDIPEGLELDDRLVIKGNTGEGPIQIEAALDRVTWEIAANLKEQKVLVVWLLDASGSLEQQRKIIAQRFKRIYGELDALGESGQIPNHDRPLLSGVVAFGEKTTFITPEPTTDVAKIIRGVERVSNDTTGIENVFGAVEQVLKRWLNYRAGRRIMIVAVTDESGDDFTAHLESAITIAKRNGARAYVLGPAATFGRRQGFVPYVHPANGKTYQLPVDIGPETAVAENVQLPYWYEGPQHEYISAGLGPYALTRLVNETGGVYFMTNTVASSGLSRTGNFEPANMKPFEPDYRFGTPLAYMKDLAQHPLRRAVVDAAERSLQNKPKGTPQLEFRVTAGNYLQQLNTAQQHVAESTLMLERIMQAYPGNLEPQYQKESSARWRAAYNLSLGRLLAQKVRCYEYNFACAQLKTLGAQEVSSKSNHWRFRPDANLNYATSMKKSALESERLLKRVLAEAPGTPWAVLAARELKDGLGIRIIQQFEPPPPPPPPAAPAKKGKTLQLAPDPRPVTPPKPQVREVPVVLPKL